MRETLSTPKAPGFYWGRWHTPAPGTDDNGEGCAGDEWEVHEVWSVSLQSEPLHLSVFVPGVSTSQPLSAFEWGPHVPQFKPNHLPSKETPHGELH